MKFRRSTLVWLFAVSFVAGVYINLYHSGGYLNWGWLTVLLIPFVWRRNMMALVVVIIIGLWLGGWRAISWQDSLNFSDELAGTNVTIIGRVVTDSVYDQRRQIQVELDNLKLVSENNQIPLKGKLRVKGFGVPLIMRHDIIKVEGKLSRRFSTRIGSLSFSKIIILSHNQSNIEKLRRSFTAKLYSAISEEKASLALGILVGQRTNLSADSELNLRQVGLTHIIAVSGYNLSVLVRLTRRGLKFLSKFQSLIISVLLVALFVLIAGNSASIIRAAWVICLSLASGYYGRKMRPLVLLMLSAAATAWFDPFYVWFDLGWWLSFMAFFGVLLVAPKLTFRVYGNKKPGTLGQVAIESLSASLLTMPIIAWAFERVSLISLIANMLVVPTIPTVMVASLMAGLVYYVWTSGIVYIIIASFASFSLGLILLIADKLAGLPFAETPISLTLLSMLLIYTLIITATYILHLKTPCQSCYDLLE